MHDELRTQHGSMASMTAMLDTTEMPHTDSAVRFHGGDAESGNVFAVETVFPPGLALASHRHPHGHLSVLAKGTAVVTVGGVSTRMTGPCVVSIPPDTEHQVAAETEVVWYCLWAADLAPMDEAINTVKVVEQGIKELSHA